MKNALLTAHRKKNRGGEGEGEEGRGRKGGGGRGGGGRGGRRNALDGYLICMQAKDECGWRDAHQRK